MKKKIYFGLIAIIMVSSGCWAPKSIITASNITQPVLVGKVITIGGNPIEKTNLQSEAPFSAFISNAVGFAFNTTYTLHQGSNLIDKQLLPLTYGSSGMLIADQIRFKVTSGYWLAACISYNKGWLDGAKYNLLNK